MIDYLYLHIPFCKSICYYCDFTHRVYDESLVDKWIDELKNEISFKNINTNLKTIYIGGGTPSCLSISQLERVFSLLSPYSNYVKEYTIEVNPETLDIDRVLLFKKYGINRISLGVQTFKQDILSSLNRKHTKDDVLNCIELLRSNGITNITCDLMYSLPNQTIDVFVDDIKTLVELKIPHISFYSLTIEDNTVFKAKGIKSLDCDTEADMYEKANKYLVSCGYNQYEVSNYCLNGYESLHNTAYWKYYDFYGLSIGASGKENHIRYDNTKLFDEYFNHKYESERIDLTLEDEMFEHLMMSLRLSVGLDLVDFKNRYNVAFEDYYKDELDQAISKKYVYINDNHLICRDRAILNTVLLCFMN